MRLEYKLFDVIEAGTFKEKLVKGEEGLGLWVKGIV